MNSMENNKNIVENAFRELNEFVDLNEPMYLKEEAPEANTIFDLLKNASSYNVLHDFDLSGIKYSLYVEGTHDGESLGMEDEFSPEKINGVIVDVLDSDHNMLGTLSDVTLESMLTDVESEAGSLMGDDTPDPEPSMNAIEDEDEPVIDGPQDDGQQDAKMLDTDFGDGQPSNDDASEPRQFIPVDADAASTDGDDSSIEIKYKDKVIVVSDANAKLEESVKLDLSNDADVEEAQSIIAKAKEDAPIEKVVDASAETVSDVKKTYIGSIILRCPVCHTMRYKDPDELLLSEDASTEDVKIYNVEDECPHCGSKDGYELIGQVASLDVNPAAESEPPIAVNAPNYESESTVEVKGGDESEKDAGVLPDELELSASPDYGDDAQDDGREVEESLRHHAGRTIELTALNEMMFDRLVRNYLRETYSNVSGYKTSNVKLDDASGNIVVDGTLIFKSGKEKTTKFVFEAAGLSRGGKVRFCGVNETFANKKKSFSLLGNVQDGVLLSESLAYSYSIEGDKVAGKVTAPTPKKIRR